MGRPKKQRFIEFQPNVSYFKPRGIPLFKLEEVSLSVDELEAFRLADLLGMSHEDGGSQMGVSRATFGRIVEKARQIIADALVTGKAIKVEGGNYKMMKTGPYRTFLCRSCDHPWKEPKGRGRPAECPSCGNQNFYRTK
ncbi:conserved hypothetical protein [Candidatus Magnetomoraceae bacterium gMMP-15]